MICENATANTTQVSIDLWRFYGSHMIDISIFKMVQSTSSSKVIYRLINRLFFAIQSIEVDIRIKWPAAHYGLFMDFLSLIIVAHHISLLIRDLFGYQFSQFRFIIRGDVSHMRE